MSQNIINTIIGNGNTGGSLALNAFMFQPMAICTDSFGNVYIFDQYPLFIKKFNVSTGIVSVVAGTGAAGYTGDGGPAILATFGSSGNGGNPPGFGSTCGGICVDSSGNIYVADYGNSVIRMINTSGTITTVAGTGVSGYNSDGIAATSAKLYTPTQVAVDSSGNLYIADYGNHRIRMVTKSTGLISTVAGTGTGGYNNAGGGLATSAELYAPVGVALDSVGNIYIMDRNNYILRKVTKSSGLISTIAGAQGTFGSSGDGGPATSAQLGYNGHITLDSSDNVYIADSNYCVRMINASTGIINTVAGNHLSGFYGDGGLAINASFGNNYRVYSMAVDGSGNLYVADWNNQRVRMVNNTSGIINTVIGGGFGDNNLASNAVIFYLYSGLAFDASNNLYFPDVRSLRKINTSTGIVSTVAGISTNGYSGDGGPATSAQVMSAYYPVVDGSGNVYFLDNYVIRKVNSSGIVSTAVGGIGDGGQATGAVTGAQGPILFNGGNVYFADNIGQGSGSTSVGRIRKVNMSSGIISTVAGGTGALSTQIGQPTGTAIDGSGNLYVSDVSITSNGVVRKITPLGSVSVIAGGGNGGDGGLATNARLSYPAGLAFDSFGNLYIADRNTHRIRMVNTSGIISTVAGNGTQGFSGDTGAATSAELNGPSGLFIDGSNNLYIADTTNNRIRMVNHSTGIINTVAGSSSSTGFSGDGAAATSAKLSHPSGIFVDGSGNIYIADTGNSRIRMVTYSTGFINTVAGAGGNTNTGDGAAATSAGIATPSGVTVDGLGNIYLATVYSTSGSFPSGTIRMVTASNGYISTIAGGTIFAGTSSGNGGPAAIAQIGYGSVTGLAIDSSNNLYFIDGNFVRQVNASTGMINAVAGNGTTTWATGVAALSTGMNGPSAPFIDGSGNFYLQENGYIRKIANLVNSAGLTSTIAGTGTAGYSGDGGPATSAKISSPTGITMDGSGNLYIVDSGNNRIRIISSGIINTFAGNGTAGYTGDGGPATSAEVQYLYSVTADPSGNIYLGCQSNTHPTFSIVRKVSASNGAVNLAITKSSDGGASPTTNRTFSINVEAQDSNGNPAAVVSNTGITLSVSSGTGTLSGTTTGTLLAGTTDLLLPCKYSKAQNGVVIEASDGTPRGMSRDMLAPAFSPPINVDPPQGGALITSPLTATAIVGQPFSYVITASGNPTITLGASSLPAWMTFNGINTLSGTPTSTGTANITLTASNSLYTDTETLVLTIAATGGTQIVRDLTNPSTFAVTLPSSIVQGMEVSTDGTIYVADSYNAVVYLVPKNGNVSLVSSDFSMPFGLTVDSSNNIYVTDNGTHEVKKISVDGTTGQTMASGFGTLGGICVDAGGAVYVADTGNNRVKKILPGGTIMVLAGPSQGLNAPQDVAIDRAGNVYVADTGNYRIRKITPDGRIFTLAGTGVSGQVDAIPPNGNGATAQFVNPIRLAIDNSDTFLYVLDGGNVVRKVALNGTVTTFASWSNNALAGDITVGIDGKIYVIENM